MSQPITREEQYLSAMASGNSTDIKPVTREEVFLAKATGQSVAIPEPITRKEVFLRDIALNGSGGGSVILKPFTLTEGGNYKAVDYGADGFSSVFADVDPAPIWDGDFTIVGTPEEGGGGSDNSPKAYHLLSADELPTDAVDGSLAVVGEDFYIREKGKWVKGIGGVIEVTELPTENIDTDKLYLYNGAYYKWTDKDTWTFNDVLTPIDKPFEEGYEDIRCSGYTEDAEVLTTISFSLFTFWGSADTLEEWYLYDADENETLIYDYEGFSGRFRHKTFTFIETPEDEVFIAWRNANAKRNSWQKYSLNARQVYTPASIEELPTNVAENSIALIRCAPKQYIFNDRIETRLEKKSYNALFRCLCGIYQDIGTDSDGNSISYSGQTVYGYDDAASKDRGWRYEGFKNIELFIADETTMAWINENATFQDEGLSQFLIFHYVYGKWQAVGVFI